MRYFSFNSKSSTSPCVQMANVVPFVGFSLVVCPVMAPSSTRQNCSLALHPVRSWPLKIGLNPSSPTAPLTAHKNSIDHAMIIGPTCQPSFIRQPRGDNWRNGSQGERKQRIVTSQDGLPHRWALYLSRNIREPSHGSAILHLNGLQDYTSPAGFVPWTNCRAAHAGDDLRVLSQRALLKF